MLGIAFFFACIVLASMLLWEAMGILICEHLQWSCRITLSQIAEGNAVFGLCLLLVMWAGVGAVTFHVLERTGITK